MNSQTTVTKPTWTGFIATTADALKLVEACLAGNLNHCARRPHDRERTQIIKSGSVFVYEQGSSGVKRWTDGLSWSPSRALGNFLLYRQLARPFPPGQKKRALKKTDKSAQEQEEELEAMSARAGVTVPVLRALVGSLTSSYFFKDDGLLKKTITVTVRGIQHHVVSYYSIADASSGRMCSPATDVFFHDVHPRPDLYNQGFKHPVDEASPIDLYNPMYMHAQDRPRQAAMALPMPAGTNSMNHHMGHSFPASNSFSNSNYPYPVPQPSGQRHYPHQSAPQHYQSPPYAASNAQQQAYGSSAPYTGFPVAAATKTQGHQSYDAPVHSNHQGYPTTPGSQLFDPAQSNGAQNQATAYPYEYRSQTTAAIQTSVVAQGQGLPRMENPFQPSVMYPSVPGNSGGRDPAMWQESYSQPQSNASWPAHAYNSRG